MDFLLTLFIAAAMPFSFAALFRFAFAVEGQYRPYLYDKALYATLIIVTFTEISNSEYLLQNSLLVSSVLVVYCGADYFCNFSQSYTFNSSNIKKLMLESFLVATLTSIPIALLRALDGDYDKMGLTLSFPLVFILLLSLLLVNKKPIKDEGGATAK